MITKSQENEIRGYLMYKKLPIDILLEVNDHFIAQISDLQQTEDIDFNAAFELTKISWKEELATYFPWYVLNKTNAVARTRFEQKIRIKANMDLLKLSLPISIMMFLSIYLMAEFGNREQLLNSIRITFVTLFILTALFIIYNFIFNSFAFNWRVQKFKYSIYQWNTPFVFIISYWCTEYLGPLSKLINSFKNNNFSFHFITQTMALFILIFAFIYTIIAQMKLAKTLKKIKPQLKFT